MVHKVSCPNAMRLKSSYGPRLVATRWGSVAEKFLATIQMEGIDRLGMLEEISTTLATRLGVNVRSLNISAQNEVFSCEVSMIVDSTDTLQKIITTLKAIKGIKTAKRIS